MSTHAITNRRLTSRKKLRIGLILPQEHVDWRLRCGSDKVLPLAPLRGAPPPPAPSPSPPPPRLHPVRPPLACASPSLRHSGDAEAQVEVPEPGQVVVAVRRAAVPGVVVPAAAAVLAVFLQGQDCPTELSQQASGCCIVQLCLVQSLRWCGTNIETADCVMGHGDLLDE